MKILKPDDLAILSHKDCVRFALFCANQVKERWEHVPECVNAIRVTELWLEDKANKEECFAVAIKAYQVSNYIGNTVSTIYVGNYALSTYYTVLNTNSYQYPTEYNDVLTKEQWEFFYELRDFDKIAEQILIGG